VIYNISYNFIFVKPRKVAGTSIEIALSALSDHQTILTPLSKVDEISRKKFTDFNAQNFNYSPNKNWLRQIKVASKRISKMQRLRYFYNHMTLDEICDAIGPQHFNTAHKISVYRPPHDYVISCYFHYNSSLENFENWYWKNRKHIFSITDSYNLGSVFHIDFMIDFRDLVGSFSEMIDAKLIGSDVLLDFEHIKTKNNRRPPQTINVEKFYENYPEIYGDIERNLIIPKKGKIQC